MPNLTLFTKGADVAQLHTQLKMLGYEIPPTELESQSFGVATRYALLQFQNQYSLTRSGEYDEASRQAVEIATGLAGSRANVQGQLFLDNGKAADGITLNVYRRNAQGQRIALGNVKTDPKGFYALPFDLPKEEALNLEITAVKIGGKEEVALHQTKYNAASQEVMNLVAPTQDVTAVASEFIRLTQDLSATKRVGSLADIKENKDRQDISYLAQATNWDGRNIALAALAVQRSAGTNVPAEAFYGLFRAGLPTGREELAQVSPDHVVQALKKAGAAGVISAPSDADLTSTRTAFESFARSVRLEAPPPGGISSFGSLLSATGLKEEQQVQFEKILMQKHDEPAQIWQKCAEAGFSDNQINSLKTQGKLGHLTRQSLPMMQALQPFVGDDPTQLHQLASQGFYEPQKWIETMKGLGTPLDLVVPPSYLGEKLEDRVAAYADDMARKIRVSYPTDAILGKITAGKIDLGAPEPNARVKVVLEKTVRQFRFGSKPIRKFVKEQEDIIFPPGMSQEEREATVRDLERLHRLHQLTPTDEAMQALLSEKLNSAEDVFKFGEEQLVRVFKNRNISEYLARFTYRKAVQIHTIAFNFLTIANEGNAAPGMHVTAGDADTAEAGRTKFRENLIREFPTLESLFGSTDFCECEHCRSVLSPAAYFVDLLRFLDIDVTSWNNFKSTWKAEHDGHDFPHDKTPFEALVQRRPDLPALPLTCENTNIALPTIDLVNEILEFFIVHNGALLHQDPLHPTLPPETPSYDTGVATTAELLAEPQHLLPTAYDTLKNAVFPIGLPFDLWLDTARRFYEQAGTTFAAGLEALRDTGELFRPAVIPAGETAKHCYRAEVFAEQLNISPTEYAIFTQVDINGNWYKYYGYSDAAPALSELVSAKKLSRRLGVTYKELAELLRTGFLNPALDHLAVLPKLGISVRDVFQYKGGAGEDPLPADEKLAFEAKLDALTAQFSASGFNARTWLDEAFTAGDFNRALLLADPNTGSNFDLTKLRFADGTDATPEIFHKINLFVRLWKKLGWSMEETDRALQTFFPKQPGAPFGEAMRTALIYLAHLKTLDEHLKLGKNSRLKWLVLWSDLPTTGKKPLYAQLFLTASALKNDAIFDDPLGIYLPDPASSALPEDQRPKLKEHLPALQSALGLSAEDIRTLLPELPNVYLSLSNVSALYRYALLGKALKMTVLDLLILKKRTGLDPFKPLEAAPLTTMETDHFYHQTIQFTEMAEAVKTSGFSVSELDYLFRDVANEKFSPKQMDVDKLLTALKTGLDQIASDFAAPLPAAAQEWPDEAIGKKLALLTVTENNEEKPIAEADATQLLKLWNGTAETDVLQKPVLPGDQILIPDTQTAVLEFLKQNGINIAYDKPQAVQQLVFKGYLSQFVLDNMPADAPAALKPMLQSIRDKQQDLLQRTLTAINATDFTPANIESLFAPWRASAPGLTDVQAQAERREWERKRREDLSTWLLPPLKLRSVQEFIVTTVTAVVSAEQELSSALLTDQNLLASNVDTTRALWTTFTDQSDAAAQLATASAYVTLYKAAYWASGLNLSLDELHHFVSNTADFDAFDLNLLHPGNASDVNAQKLTTQHLRLAAYVRVRSDLQTTGEKLLPIFRAARRTFSAGTTDEVVQHDSLLQPCLVLAELLGKNSNDFLQMAEAIGLNISITNSDAGIRTGSSKLVQEAGLRRLLDAFAIKEKLRASVDAVRRWSVPNPDSTTAIHLRNTVKGLYELETWQQVAQPIFDRLRQRQRDALVAYVLHHFGGTRGFSTLEQLYEYLLIDPGMEPIVQTSRLRQAIASVQLFVQRSLLNLEMEVNPSTINAAHWAWMKRYRLWEANRKLFLFPENWLEPEFRDDKTHLYRALESELLQGDISNDTAERAFFNYLQGLEQISRLEMVTMYLEEPDKTDPSSNTLHVVGRTFNKPHVYYYRRYAHGMWTPWEPIDAEIESDHVVAVKWRDRLHLLWLTFLQKPVVNTAETTGKTAQTIGNSTSIDKLNSPVYLQAQLNWVEYFQGEWKGRQATTFRDLNFTVGPSFDPRTDMFVHATKEFDAEGYDTALNIHLNGVGNTTFKIVSKLAPPESGASNVEAQALPLNMSNMRGFATKVKGNEKLHVRLETEINKQAIQEGGITTMIINSVIDNPVILDKHISDFTLLTTSTPFQFGDEKVGDDRKTIGALMRPFFYEDNQHTFFVEPTFDEVTIERWEEWTVPEYVPGTRDYKLDDFEVKPAFPRYYDYVEVDVNPLKRRGFGGDPIDPRAKYQFQNRHDWVTNPLTMVKYEDVLVTNQGGFSPEVFSPQITQLGITGVLGNSGVLGNMGVVGNAGTVVLAGGGTESGTSQGTELVVPVGLTAGHWNELSQALHSGSSFSVVTSGGFGRPDIFTGNSLGNKLNNKFNTGGR